MASHHSPSSPLAQRRNRTKSLEFRQLTLRNQPWILSSRSRILLSSPAVSTTLSRTPLQRGRVARLDKEARRPNREIPDEDRSLIQTLVGGGQRFRLSDTHS